MDDRNKTSKSSFVRAVVGTLAVLALASVAPAAQSDEGADVIVITNAMNPEASLTAQQIKDIYLGDKTRWPASGAVAAYARPGESVAGGSFFKNVLHMAPSRFRRHWQERSFAWKPGKAPEEINDADSLMKRVAGEPGAIGFLARSEGTSPPSGVRVISIQ